MFHSLKDYLSLNPAQFGLVLTYIFEMMGLFQWAVRQSTEVENLVFIHSKI